MADGGDRFCADSELSDILSKLWDLDDNKCYPGVEYEINLQGFVTSTRDTSRDFARRNLFEWVDEEKLFERETYRTFHDLLDNYEMDVAEDEEVTWEERKENWNFLRAIMKTEVMKEAQQFLVSKGQASSDEDEFMRMLHDIWFRLFRRKGGRWRKATSATSLLKQLHWLPVEARVEYKLATLAYRYFDGTLPVYLSSVLKTYVTLHHKMSHIVPEVRDDEIIRLIAMQFDWRGTKSKPMCSCFIGSSPEFEIAAYTICLLLDRDGRTDCQIGEYEVELTVHSFGRQRKLGSAFMSASRLR